MGENGVSIVICLLSHVRAQTSHLNGETPILEIGGVMSTSSFLLLSSPL